MSIFSQHDVNRVEGSAPLAPASLRNGKLEQSFLSFALNHPNWKATNGSQAELLTQLAVSVACWHDQLDGSLVDDSNPSGLDNRARRSAESKHSLMHTLHHRDLVRSFGGLLASMAAPLERDSRKLNASSILASNRIVSSHAHATSSGSVVDELSLAGPDLFALLERMRQQQAPPSLRLPLELQSFPTQPSVSGSHHQQADHIAAHLFAPSPSN